MSEGLTYMPFGASKFVELFLSLEGHLARHVMPEVKTNPFCKLEDAHKMCVAKCFSHMVSVGSSQWLHLTDLLPRRPRLTLKISLRASRWDRMGSLNHTKRHTPPCSQLSWYQQTGSHIWPIWAIKVSSSSS